MTTTSSHVSSMNFMLCSTITTVLPRATNCLMAWLMRSPSTGFTPPIGSSRITEAGLRSGHPGELNQPLLSAAQRLGPVVAQRRRG